VLHEVSPRFYIGTSGWNYESWSDGVFYPSKLSTARWLEFYAKHFGTVEVNNTFYRLPEKRVFREWQKRTPQDFVFAVKASRFITHMKKLAEPQRHLARFLGHARELGRKLSVVLVQLPPFWKFDEKRLEAFAGYLAQQRIIPRLRVALELRNATWRCEACFDLLRQYGVALAFTDWAGLRINGPVTANFVFVRRHGPEQRYKSNYSEAALRRDARRVRAWLSDGQDVYVYFNNDAFGYAVRNAMRLRELATDKSEPPYRQRWT